MQALPLKFDLRPSPLPAHPDTRQSLPDAPAQAAFLVFNDIALFIVMSATLCTCAGGISGHRVRALRCRPCHYLRKAIAKAPTAKINRLRKVRGFDDFACLSATDTQHAAHRERRAVPNNRDKTILRLWICRHWVFSIVTCRQHHCGGFGRIIGKSEAKKKSSGFGNPSEFWAENPLRFSPLNLRKAPPIKVKKRDGVFSRPPFQLLKNF